VLNFPGHKKNSSQNYTNFIPPKLKWLSSRTQTSNVGEDEIKEELLYTVDGNVN
jgi:hypothetical protein